MMFMLPVRGEYWVTETWASEGDEEQTVVFHGLEGKVCDPNSLASAFFLWLSSHTSDAFAFFDKLLSQAVDLTMVLLSIMF